MNQKLKSTAQKSPRTESSDWYDPQIFKSEGPTHSGVGYRGESIVLFVIGFGVFCFGIYSLGMYPTGGWLWWCIAMAAMLLPWGIVYHLLASKTNRSHRENGTDLTQL